MNQRSNQLSVCVVMMWNANNGGKTNKSACWKKREHFFCCTAKICRRQCRLTDWLISKFRWMASPGLAIAHSISVWWKSRTSIRSQSQSIQCIDCIWPAQFTLYFSLWLVDTNQIMHLICGSFFDLRCFSTPIFTVLKLTLSFFFACGFFRASLIRCIHLIPLLGFLSNFLNTVKPLPNRHWPNPNFLQKRNTFQEWKIQLNGKTNSVPRDAVTRRFHCCSIFLAIKFHK